jgi:hypothetical protein
VIRALTLATALAFAAPAEAETLTCATSFQGYRICQGAGGYRSTEWKWQDRVIGDDNRGNRWTTSRWQDREVTTVTPGPDR